MTHPHQLVREAFPGLFPETPPLPQPDPGQLGAFLAKLGLSQEDIRRILADEVKVEIILREVVQPLFDRHGRRRPTQGMKYAVTDPDYYKINVRRPILESEEQWAAVFASFASAFNCGITLEDWHGRIEAIRTFVQSDPQIKNLLRGSCFPLLIPALPEIQEGEEYDYGTELESMLMLVKQAYGKTTFPARKFLIYLHRELEGKITLLPESRQAVLQARRAVGVVPALWFPQALQGYSVLADREQMESLPYPDRIILGGAIEAAVAMIGYARELVFSSETPIYDLAASQSRSAQCSPHFMADDLKLEFNHRASLDEAYPAYSAGLLVLG